MTAAETSAPILIFGPTASGKSALALALAERLGGAVINADAAQVYSCWRVLTARPAPADEARAPHLLYGHVDPTAPHSVGRWLAEARAALDDCAGRGLRPIVVGGTGLYFAALTGGLADIPPPSPQLRTAGRARLAALGRAGLAAEIAARDPDTFATIDAANPARLLRAWETLEATGRGLAALRAATPPPLLPLSRARALALVPPRAALHAACDARFEAMLRGGALEEARAVASLDLPTGAPALKAIGARELIAHVRGETPLDAAAAAAKTATRRYVKRQMTWLRGRMIAWRWLEAQDHCEFLTLATDFLGDGA